MWFAGCFRQEIRSTESTPVVHNCVGRQRAMMEVAPILLSGITESWFQYLSFPLSEKWIC